MGIIENNNICAVTEFTDKDFPKSRIAIITFLSNNKWFDGTIYILLTKDGISSHNKNMIKSVYDNVNFIATDEIDVNQLRKLAFNFNSPSVVYFSRYSVFQSDISECLKEGTISSFEKNKLSLNREYKIHSNIDTSLMVISKLDQIKNIRKDLASINTFNVNDSINEVITLNNVEVYSNIIGISANYVRNKNYRDFIRYVKSISYISYEDTSSSDHSRINMYWIGLNKKVKNPTPIDIKSSSISNKTEGNLPNKKDWDRRYKLNQSLLKKSNLEFSQLIKIGATESELSNQYDTGVVIAFKGRHSIVELNIESLGKQTMVPAIILVVSNIEDYNFALDIKRSYPNIFITLYENYPIGGKWNAGVKYAQKLNVKGLMILGSDDLLSLNYFKECFTEIDEGRGSSGAGVDLIGNRSWFIYDTTENLYYLTYTDKVNVMLGGGKMFSKHFLDSVDWNIFLTHRPKHLDSYGYELVEIFSNKIKIIDPSNFILSIKGKWEVINTTHAILKANHRISYSNVTDMASKIFRLMKINNINKYVE